ncbi:MAG: beta strand repeat-containing protein, partial [Verrucomicrobiota bacterium]
MKFRRSLLLSCSSSLALISLTFSSAQAGTTWDGGGAADTNINTAANWDANALPTSLTDGSQTLTFGTGGSTATINTDVNAAGLVINSSGNFTIADGAGNLTVGTGGITVTLPSTTARTHTISESNLTLAGNQTWSVTNNTGTATLNVSSAITDGASTFNLSKNGTGVLGLSGSNSYDGTTTINGGTLTISNDNALGSTVGGTTIASGASLNLQGGITVGEALTHNGGTSGYLRNVSGNNTWNGNINIGASNSRISSAAGLLTIGGNITMTSATIFEGAGNLSITGVVSGSNNLVMGANMAGVLTLSGSNTYNGSTNVGAGTLSVSSMNNQNTSGVFGNNNAQIYLGAASTNGTLQYTGSGVTTDRRIRIGNAVTDTGNAIVRNDGSGALVFNWSGQFNQATGNTTANRTLTLGGTNTDLNTITGAIVDNTASTGLVGLIKADAGTWVLSGNNTYSGATVINQGTLQIGAGSTSGSISSSSAISNNATLVINRSNAIGISNAISGNGTLIKRGAGTLTLSGSNSYTGLTDIQAGTISLGNSTGTIADTAAVQVSGGTLDVANSDTVGAVTLSSGTISGVGTLTGASYSLTDAGTVSATLAGNGALTKSGSGTATLSGNNTYSGGTTLSAGRLQVAHSSSLGNGTFILTNGAVSSSNSTAYTLANALSINGDVVIGDATNNGTLTFSGNADLGAATRSLTINSSVRLSGALTNGGLTKNGTSTLTLSGDSNFAGATTVNAG